MYETTILIFLLVLVVLLYQLLTSVRAMHRAILELANNPVKHTVAVSSDFSEQLNDIALNVTFIEGKVGSIERHLVPDDDL